MLTRMSRSRCPIAGAVALLYALVFVSRAQAQVPDPRLWVTDGDVYATVLVGDTLYFGGQFNHIGANEGGCAVLDPTTGARVAAMPRVNGSVLAVAADGAGGWYLGGTFTAVAGVPRSNLAHVRADGSVDAWDPNASAAVNTLTRVGDLVYVGGGFSSLGGQVRHRIASVDATSGQVTAWDPDASDNITSLAVSGNTVYVAGYFSTVGGQARSRIAAIDATTGQVTPWNPSSSELIWTLAVSGNTVYVGGIFTSIGGQPRNRIAAIDATTGLATAWNPNADSWVQSLAVSGGIVYAGGAFTNIGGQPRSNLAALSASTGQATAWNPSGNAMVW